MPVSIFAIPARSMETPSLERRLESSCCVTGGRDLPRASFTLSPIRLWRTWPIDCGPGYQVGYLFECSSLEHDGVGLSYARVLCSNGRTTFSGVVPLPRMRLMFHERRALVRWSIVTKAKG